MIKSESESTTGRDNNAVNLFEANKTALIIIDVQEKLIKGIPHSENMIFNLNKVSDACQLLDVNTFYSEQNPQKLGNTIEELIKVKESNIFPKMSFSCYACNGLIKELELRKIENILITGVETHVCIMQSAFDFYRYGFNVQVISDAVMSRNSYDHNMAINRMANAGITISSSEMAIFELCKTASNSRFKEVSKIIKRIRE